MKPSPILIVRRPGLKTRSGNCRQLSSPPFLGGPGVEFLFLDIRKKGKNCPWGTAFNRPLVQKNKNPWELSLNQAARSLVQDHKPEKILILRGGDRSGWDKKAERIFGNLVPEILICTEQAPCPWTATHVRLGAFETGRDLAEHLAGQTGQARSGYYDFVVDPELLEKGVQGIFERIGPWERQNPWFVKFCLCLPVPGDIDWSPMENSLRDLFERGLVMVHWELAGPGSCLPRELLWKVSKQGIWNHVSGLDLFGPAMQDRHWIANTPNIIHSFEDLNPAATGAGVIPPGFLLDYGKLPDLPGRPLWQVIRDPGLLLPCLEQISAHQLLRLRADETGAIYAIGTRIKYFFKRPDQISGDLMEKIVAMVDAGGSVDITHVRANLKKAYLIGYAMENGCVVGNSSLKHPRQAFIERLRGMTGLDFTRCVERGYTSVRPEYRAMGIGANLLEGLTKRAVGVTVFSIISEDNLATQKIAIRNNTRKITAYFSDKLGKKMGVWMPEHMIPTEWGRVKDQQRVNHQSGTQDSGK